MGGVGHETPQLTGQLEVQLTGETGHSESQSIAAEASKGHHPRGLVIVTSKGSTSGKNISRIK